MGGSTWSSHVYRATTDAKVRDHGSAFVYTATTSSTPRDTWKVHESLDPKKLNKAGVKIRESRDSDAMPITTAVIVALDETGSMGSVFDPIQKALPRLNSLLVGKGYLAGPQILFAAIGDATCREAAPVQVGQFESGNEMDEALENILIEGGGGGGIQESYELMAYFLNRYTSIDCWERRGRKGYLFFVGDEQPYPRIKPRLVQEYIGDGLQEALDSVEIFHELQQRYEVFYILPKGASHGGEKAMLAYWRTLLGVQNVLELDDPSAVADLIAATIGSSEGLGMDDIRDDLIATGASPATTRAVSTALGGRPASGSAIAEVNRELDVAAADDTESSVERL